MFKIAAVELKSSGGEAVHQLNEESINKMYFRRILIFYLQLLSALRSVHRCPPMLQSHWLRFWLLGEVEGSEKRRELL